MNDGGGYLMPADRRKKKEMRDQRDILRLRTWPIEIHIRLVKKRNETIQGKRRMQSGTNEKKKKNDKLAASHRILWGLYFPNPWTSSLAVKGGSST